MLEETVLLTVPKRTLLGSICLYANVLLNGGSKVNRQENDFVGS